MKKTHQKRWLKFLSASLVTGLLFGCNHTEEAKGGAEKEPFQRVPLSQLQLKPASDCTDLKQYVIDSAVKSYTYISRYQYYSCGVGGVTTGTGADVPASASPSAGSADSPSAGSADSAAGGSGGAAAGAESRSPDGVSDTNNQEAGVNEGDIVKTDADGNLFILSGNHFIVADGFPADRMSKLAEIDLGARGRDLFLDKANKRVVVVVQKDKVQPYYITEPVATGGGVAAPLIYPGPVPNYFIAMFFDVSDPAQPAVVDQVRFQGYFREGRRIDGRMHLVSSHNINTPNFDLDAGFQKSQAEYSQAVQDVWCNEANAGYEDVVSDPAVMAAKDGLAADIARVVNAVDAADYLPKAFRDAGGNPEAISYLACSDVNHPDVNMSLGLQIVTSVDTNGGNLSASGIVGNSGMTYVSDKNLYLADTSYQWLWWSESLQPPMSQTAIHKFSISSNKPAYVATGRVDGYVLNQFSFSEHNGALRVATTRDDSIDTINEAGQPTRQSIRENQLAILSDNGVGELAVVGEVRNIAPSEMIRSVRFMGDRGFVVTFRNIDPLFTFDLSDPANPQLRGELEITGFSSYMHAYDDTHLLTIGVAGGANGTGVGSGFKLQLFDVADLTKPVLIQSLEPTATGGWSSSSAQYDHKAFTFYKPANLLAIPMRLTPNDGSQPFNGVVAFRVTVDGGFEELGRVDHSDLAFQYYCENNSALLPGYIDSCGNSGYSSWAEPRRSVVMTDNNDVYLYTISDMGIKVGQVPTVPVTGGGAAQAPELSVTLASFLFPPQPYPWWYFGGRLDSIDIVGLPIAGGTGGGFADAGGGSTSASAPLILTK